MPLFFKSKTSGGASKPVTPVSPAPTVQESAPDDPGVQVSPSDPALERRIVDVGNEFLDLARGGKSGLRPSAPRETSLDRLNSKDIF